MYKISILNQTVFSSNNLEEFSRAIIVLASSSWKDSMEIFKP